MLIDNSARCLVEPDLLDRRTVALREAITAGAGIVAAVPVTDNIKEVDRDGTITATPDRSRLWDAQTPTGLHG